MPKHPRDRFITVYGRKPVTELLEQSDSLEIAKVLLSKKVKGDFAKKIVKLCNLSGIELRIVSPQEVSRISKHPKHDQGVVADVVAPGMDHALEYFEENKARKDAWLALDGVTTPANVGLIIRSATALGLGVILPLHGSSKINPLVIKSSAGTIFKSRMLKAERLQIALEAAKKAGYQIYGLAGEEGSPISKETLSEKAVFVMGNETHGVGEEYRSLIDAWLTIPMYSGVESLNVACAATIVAHEVARRAE
jgi:23S rRNA (guanosine2251-2'-O)-methyltransferase